MNVVPGLSGNQGLSTARTKCAGPGCTGSVASTSAVRTCIVPPSHRVRPTLGRADERRMTGPIARSAGVRRGPSAGRTGHALRVVTDVDATPEPLAADAEPTRAAELPDRLAYLRVVGLAALIGTPAALVAALFLALVHQVEHLLWTDLPDALGESTPPWYLVVALPVAGAAIVLAARLWLPGDGGHAPLLGVAGGATPLHAAPGVLVAAIGSLAFGAVLGPEAPLI